MATKAAKQGIPQTTAAIAAVEKKNIPRATLSCLMVPMIAADYYLLPLPLLIKQRHYNHTAVPRNSHWSPQKRLPAN